MEHIRQKITRLLVEIFEKQKVKSFDEFYDFIYSEAIGVIFLRELYNAFFEYAKKINEKEIIVKESVISFTSVASARCNKFKSSLTGYFLKEKTEFSQDLKEKCASIRHMEKIIKLALTDTINEKDNIFTIINEKRTLLN